MTLIYIEWFDSSLQNGEVHRKELSPRTVLHSAGILVSEDGDHVSFAADQYEEDADRFRYVSHIPKVNIVRTQRFEVKEEQE